MTLYVDTKPTLDDWVADHTNPVIAQYHCDTAFGRYTIGRIGKRFELFFKGLVTNGFHPFDTLEAAKAAAQADYERRTAERFREVEMPDTFDADEYLNTLDIFHHPYITDRTNTEAYVVAELMARFVEHWAQSAIGAGEGDKSWKQ